MPPFGLPFANLNNIYNFLCILKYIMDETYKMYPRVFKNKKTMIKPKKTVITELPFKIVRILPRFRVFEKNTGIIRYFQDYVQIADFYCVKYSMVTYVVYDGEKRKSGRKDTIFCRSLEIKRLPNIVVLINDVEHSFNGFMELSRRVGIHRRLISDLILEFVNKNGLYIEEEHNLN